MKTPPKISNLPLYIADALMFVAVFLIALPNITTGEPLSAGVVTLCSLMVLGGMALLLFPYRAEAARAEREAKDKKGEIDENLNLIFEDLSSLHASIADLQESADGYAYRIEAIEQKLSAPDDSVKAEDLAQLSANIKTATSEKFKELEDSIMSVRLSAGEVHASNLESDKIIAELCSDITILKNLMPASADSIADDLFALKSRLDSLENSLATTSNTQVPAFESEDFDDIEEDDFDNPDSDDDIEDDLDDEDDDEADSIADDDDDFFDEDISDDSDEPINFNAPEGMLGRALAASENSKDSVEKFISIRKENSITDEEEPTTESVEREFDKIASNTENIVEPILEEIPQEENYSQEIQEDDDADFFDLTDSPAPTDESAKQETPNSQETLASKSNDDMMLFDELPVSTARPLKVKKGDAAVTINTLIGIGNKPYLRGVGGGLSSDKGVAMDYIEIGKWRYVFPNAEEPITFKVYKNDETISEGGEEFTLSPNQKLDLTLNFPLE